MEAKTQLVNYQTLLNQKDETIIALKQLINEKDNIIMMYKEKIKDLEIKLEQYGNKETNPKGKDVSIHIPINNITYNFSKINFQERIPLMKIEPNSGAIYTIKKLSDDRIACGFSNGNIIIFSKEKYKKEIELKDYHIGGHITFLTQLKNDIFISCGSDGIINFFKIFENQCNKIQSIKAHSGRAMKLRELELNKQLVSCSEDKTLNFYIYQNEYIIEQKITIDAPICNQIETKNGKLVLAVSEDKIQFFDLNKRKMESQITGIKLYNGLSNNMININEKLIAVGGLDNILIIDVISQKKINVIAIPGSSYITCFNKFNDNILLTGDCSCTIRQWKITGEFLNQQYFKEKSHDFQIRFIEKYENGLIITCSDDGSLKLW